MKINHKLSEKYFLSLLRYWPYFFIITIIAFFYANLFIPKLSLYFTVDANTSDIWNFHYPVKAFLAESLHQGQLPLWNKFMGTGFPVFAESQIGTFFLPNLVLFYFLPTIIAWNLSFVLASLFNFFGSYFFLRHLKLSKEASLFGGFCYTFSAFFVTHFVHLSMIQVTSLLPWLFLCFDKFLYKPTKRLFLILIFLLSQSIFGGYLQYTFITLVGLFLWFVGRFYFSHIPLKISKLMPLILFIILSIGISAIQLLPSFELASESGRKQGINQQAMFFFPLKLNDLITFIIPKYYGTPENGTYPPVSTSQGFYWENIAYIGLIPLILVIYLLFKKLKTVEQKTCFSILLISLLLALGKTTPLVFLYSFPPFNLFRIPNRFLLLTIFSLSLLAAFGLDSLLTNWKMLKKQTYKKQIFATLILLIAVLDLFRFHNYNPIISASKALTPPQTSTLLPADARVLTHATHTQVWQNQFYQLGWQQPDIYLYLRNGLAANSNLLFHVTQISAYAGLKSTRQDTFEALLNSQTINLGSVNYLLALKPLDSPQFHLISSISPNQTNFPSYLIYQNRDAKPRFRLVTDFISVSSPDAAATEISVSKLNKDILEIPTGQPLPVLKQADIKVIVDDHQYQKIETNTNSTSYLIVADSFYPGWQATINKQTTTIFAANLNQRAVLVPAGHNTIEFRFQPPSLKKGALITLMSILAILILIRVMTFKSIISKTKQSVRQS